MSGITGPLTQSESALLQNDGAFMLQYVPNLMVESLAWGFHIVAMSLALYTLNKRGFHHSWPRLILVATVIFMFSSSSALFALHIYQFAVQLKGIYLTNTVAGQSLADKSSASALLNDKAAFANDFLFGFEFLIGDAIVLWRTWAVWIPRQHVVSIPISLWVLSFGCLIAWVITRVTESIEPFGWGDFNFRNDDPDFLLLTNYALSLSVNGVSTLMIGYRAWQNGSFIKASYEHSNRPTQVQKTMSILVESGLIYFVLFSIQLINFVPDPEVSGIAAAIIASLGNQLLGLYPTLIIIIVYMRLSIWDSPEVSQAMTTIAFDSNIAHQETHTDDSSEETNTLQNRWNSSGGREVQFDGHPETGIEEKKIIPFDACLTLA